MSTPDATVLVVEDEDSFVEALTVGLKREGFRVQVARDGAEALDMFDAVRPDLVLLDVMLPKVSGIDVCRELRRRSYGADHHGHRQGQRDRHGGGPRGGRRRLRHQAVPAPRAGRPHAGRAAPPGRRGRGARVLERRRARGRRRGPRPRAPRGRHPRRRRCRCRSRSSSCSRSCSPTPVGCCPATRSSTAVWGTDYVGDTKTLDVHVKRLRAKVEPDPSAPTRIVTIRGLGLQVRGAAGSDGAGRADAGRPVRWPRCPPRPAGSRSSHPSSGRAPTRSTCRRSPGWPGPHVLVAAGDALVTIALANSLFFDLDPNDARWKVFLYLALTMAPLAVVAPFIGPALDRSVGGRRWMIVGVTAGRAAGVPGHDRRPPEPAAVPGGVRRAGAGQGLQRVAERRRPHRRAQRRRAGGGELEAPAPVRAGRAAGGHPGGRGVRDRGIRGRARWSRWSPT